MHNRMTILIIEDDQNICDAFEEIISKRNEVELIGKTNSSIEAIKFVKENKPEAIIVDLELHHGIGSGFDFLRELKNINVKTKPIVVVNTNIISDIVYEKLHQGLADIIFYKKQKDYSPKTVIDSLVLLRNNGEKSDTITNNNIENVNQIIEDIINTELDLIRN